MSFRCDSCSKEYASSEWSSFLCFLCHQCLSKIFLPENHPEQIIPPYTTSPFLPPDTKFGHYVLIQQIEEGGMAVIYQAHHEILKKDYALKILKPSEDTTLYEEDILRFYHEFRSASHLQHFNIIQVYEAGLIGTLHFFSLELLSGYSLADLLQKQHQISEEDAINFGIYMAQALQHAHEQNIFHRDLKPENILLREDFSPLLTDFGLAPDAELDRRLSESGFTLGTPDYMSPEQALSEPCNQRSDIYSLGVVLYELVSGKVPFVAETPAEIMDLVVNSSPVPLQSIAEVSKGYHQVVMKCIEKKPSNRYAQMQHLEMDLWRVKQGRTPYLGSSFWQKMLPWRS